MASAPAPSRPQSSYRLGDVVLVPFERVFNPGLSPTGVPVGGGGRRKKGDASDRLVTLPLPHRPPGPAATAAPPPTLDFDVPMDRLFAPAIVLGVLAAPEGGDTGAATAGSVDCTPASFPYVFHREKSSSPSSSFGGPIGPPPRMIVRLLSHPEEAIVSVDIEVLVPWVTTLAWADQPSAADMLSLLNEVRESLSREGDDDEDNGDDVRPDHTPRDESADFAVRVNLSRRQICHELRDGRRPGWRVVLEEWAKLWLAWSIALVSCNLLQTLTFRQRMAETVAERPMPGTLISRWFPPDAPIRTLLQEKGWPPRPGSTSLTASTSASGSADDRSVRCVTNPF